MNSTSPASVSINDSNSAPLLQTQKPLDLKVYFSAFASGVQILTVSIGVVGITSNLLALIVFLTHKPLLKRPANYFLVSQCTINLLVSIILILTAMLDGSNWPPSMVVPMCYLLSSRSFFTGLFISSIYNIALLTVERYLEIVHPIKHHLMISKGRVITSIIATTLMVIITAVCIGCPGVKIINGSCTVGNFPTVAAARVFAASYFLVEYLIPIIVFTFCYTSMARSLHRISNITQPGNVAVQPIDPKISRARRNIIKTLFIIVLAFIICSTFKHFLVLVSLVGNIALDLGGLAFNVGQFLSYLNCCNDPFIYAFHYEEFRIGLRKLFCRFQVKPSGSSTTHVETSTTRVNK